jgi:hypothetical protein
LVYADLTDPKPQRFFESYSICSFRSLHCKTKWTLKKPESNLQTQITGKPIMKLKTKLLFIVMLPMFFNAAMADRDRRGGGESRENPRYEQNEQRQQFKQRNEDRGENSFQRNEGRNGQQNGMQSRNANAGGGRRR